jgi:glutamate-ammonia-ligase adenylyltransferase
MRMERELGRERGTRFDLKTGRGGLLDIEFASQWLQMRYGSDWRVRTTDTLEALSRLRNAGYLSELSSETFRQAYLFLRRLDQRIRVARGTGTSVIDPAQPGLDALARRLGIARRPYASEAELLLQTYRETTDAVRATYRSVLGL